MFAANDLTFIKEEGCLQEIAEGSWNTEQLMTKWQKKLMWMRINGCIQHKPVLTVQI